MHRQPPVKTTWQDPTTVDDVIPMREDDPVVWQARLEKQLDAELAVAQQDIECGWIDAADIHTNDGFPNWWSPERRAESLRMREYAERGTDPIYNAARREHAWLLRADGLNYREIGDRLGISYGRARQIVLHFGREVQIAIRWPRFLRLYNAFNSSKKPCWDLDW